MLGTGHPLAQEPVPVITAIVPTLAERERQLDAAAP